MRERAPEFDSTPLARPFLVLLPFQADGIYTKDQVDGAPRVMVADDPSSLTGLNPGTLVLGTDGTLNPVGAGGTPAAVGTAAAVVAAAADATSALAKAAALGAENVDVSIPGDLAVGDAVSGTWTRTRQGTALYRLRRTAAAALEVFAFRFRPRVRTTTSKGFKVTGYRLVYAISTALVTDVTVSGSVLLPPATGASPAAATSFGAVTYDAAHDTAGERGATGSHTMAGTFATPIYLNGGVVDVELAVSVDGSATGVVDIIGIELIGAETLVDLT